MPAEGRRPPSCLREPRRRIPHADGLPGPTPAPPRPRARVFTHLPAPDRAAEMRSPAHGSGLGSSGPRVLDPEREAETQGSSAGGRWGTLGDPGPETPAERAGAAGVGECPLGTGPALTEHLLAALRVRLVGVDPLKVAAACAVAHGEAGERGTECGAGLGSAPPVVWPAARERLGPRGGDSGGGARCAPGLPGQGRCHLRSGGGTGAPTGQAWGRLLRLSEPQLPLQESGTPARATREASWPPGCAGTLGCAHQPSPSGRPR